MQSIKEINELRVLSTVREEGPISRASLAKRLNLSRAAITGITQRLVSRRLLTEVGKGTASVRGGRREVLLAINPNAGTILAVEIEVNYACFGLLDMNAQLIEKQTFRIESGMDLVDVLKPIADGLFGMLSKHAIPVENLLGIGVGIPGVINYEMGAITEAWTLEKWRGFGIRGYLEQMFGIPAFIENNVKTMTLGEFKFGSGKNVRDLVSLWVGDGIGAGIIVNGRLLRGATSSAGEIGYNEYLFENQSNLSLLLSKQQRDWGDLLSNSNIRGAVRRGISAGWTTRLKGDCTIEEIIDAGEAGDPLALHLLKRFGWILSTVCTNLILCLNPPLLILNGILFQRTSLVADEVRQRVAHGILRSPIEGVEIRTGLLGENAVLMGATGLVLDDLFHFPEYQSKTRCQRMLMRQSE